MDRKVFVDTSFWIAYSLKGEPEHERIIKLFSKIIRDGVTVCTSSDVIDETVTRLATATNSYITNTFIGFIEESIDTRRIIELWVDEHVQTEAFRLVEKFVEHRLSMTDATSVALMKRLNIQSILTLDSDFVKIGISVLP